MKKKILNKKNIYLLFFFFLIFNTTINSQITYFYTDNLLFKYLHEISIERKLFEILLQKYSVNGIPVIPIFPYLNPLSFLNYQINSDIDYILYLLIFRIFEFITIIIILKSFFKDKVPSLYFSILVFSSLIFYFNIFDHLSYINIPIIIFNLTISTAYYFKNNKLYYLIIFFLGNLWSFLISPVYFFITCFIPLLFYYFYLIFSKEYKIFIITFLCNIPFTIIYILIILGTSRFFFGDEIINEKQMSIYNFSFFNSYILSILIIAFLFLAICSKRTLNNFTLSFIVIIFFFTIIGFIYKYNLVNWFLPHPNYLEYSFQYILISAFIFIIYELKNNLKKILVIFLLIITFNQLFKNFNNFINHKKLIVEKKFVQDTKMLKRHFWQQNQLIFLKKNYSEKVFFINMPNSSSNFSKYLLNKTSDTNLKQDTTMLYNNDFEHSLTPNEFFDSQIVVNIGHSLLIDTSTVAVNLKNFNEKIFKNVLPRNTFKNELNHIYNIDYVLSDVKLNLELKEIINFKNFELYIYKYHKSKSKKFERILHIDNYKDFYLNRNKMNNNFYAKFNLKEFKTPIEKCKLTRQTSKKYLQFSINALVFPCLAVFPITFSRVNEFIDLKNNKLETFRGQYFFHSYVFSQKNLIIVKKKNIFNYAYNSFLDFKENKEILSSYKKFN